MSNTLEIFGTLNAPYIPELPEGLPRLAVNVTALTGGDERIVATCSAQATGSPMPFRLHLDPLSLGDTTQVTVEARCTVGVGEDAVLARATQVVEIDALQGIPLDLNLEAVQSNFQDTEKHPIQPVVIELNGHVNVPSDLRQEAAYLDATLLLVQEDGYSNRYSSNLAEHSLYLKDDGAPFSLFIDAASLPAGQQVKLHLGLYDRERKVILGGNSVRDLDLSSPPDLSTIVLRKPRR
jgi:hypothetical protein